MNKNMKLPFLTSSQQTQALANRHIVSGICTKEIETTIKHCLKYLAFDGT